MGGLERGTDEEQIVLNEIILEALLVQCPGAQLLDEFVMCVVSPVIFDFRVREEVVYEMASLPVEFRQQPRDERETNRRGDYGAKGRM